MDYIKVRMIGEKAKMTKLMKLIGNMKARVIHVKTVEDDDSEQYDVAFTISSRRFGKAVRKLSRLGDVIVS